MNNARQRSVLWWGRFDPDYSRNRVLRKQFVSLGWQVCDFIPLTSALADTEALLRRIPVPDLVWVPCFRQRDVRAASRWARRHGVPLVFDPLISAFDKQVDERRKFPAQSHRASRLLRWEQDIFNSAGVVIADTPAHADYYVHTLAISERRVSVIYVGAEESLFQPQSLPDRPGAPIEVLFYGSFIPLQGPQVVVEAARLYQGPPVRWVLLGQGPLRAQCETAAKGVDNVVFEDWLPYPDLPRRIHQADILLGVFGTTPKANRVIPNKVFQALACGRPVVTRTASAYPGVVSDAPESGLIWITAGDPAELADRIAVLASNDQLRQRMGDAAARTFLATFSEVEVERQLRTMLAGLGFHDPSLPEQNATTDQEPPQP